MNNIETVKKLIKNRFSFLFDAGFKIDEGYLDRQSGYWVVTLTSPSFNVRFRKDRGQVFMSFGPSWSSLEPLNSAHYVDLGVVMAFLTGDTKYFAKFFNKGSLSSQIRRTAEVSYSHFGQISKLFSDDGFLNKEKELSAFGKKLFYQLIEDLKSNRGK